MEYDMMIHLANTIENFKTAYETQNIELFENTYQIIKDLFNHNKRHTEFLLLLSDEESKYEKNITDVEQKLIERLKHALEMETNEDKIKGIARELQRYEEDLQAFYAKYVNDRKTFVMDYLPQMHKMEGHDA